MNVGNSIRNESGQLIEIHPQLSEEKLYSWFYLRYLHMKYLLTAIQSHLNYFDYVLSTLYSTIDLKAENSSINGIFNIMNSEGELVRSESSIQQSNEIISQIVNVVTYYLSKIDDMEQVDWEKMLEKALSLELEFLSSKKKLIESYIEILQHTDDQTIITCIENIIGERPRFSLLIFSSYEYSYQYSIRLMKSKSLLCRNLISFYVQHERQVNESLVKYIPCTLR